MKVDIIETGSWSHASFLSGEAQYVYYAFTLGRFANYDTLKKENLARCGEL